MRHARAAAPIVLALLAPTAGAQAIASIEWATYLGGPGTDITLREATFDAAGNIIVVGHGATPVADFPGARVIGPIAPTADGNIVVAKISADGSTLLWTTLIGGSGRDRGYGLDLDAAGNLYIAGRTSSTDLPTTPGAFDETYNGGTPNPAHGASDAYCLKLSPDGDTLEWCTYLGGSLNDGARGGLAVSADGFAHAVGFTASPDFLGPIPEHVNSYIGGDTDAFITKLAQDGSSVVWSRFLAAAGPDIEEVVVGAQIHDVGRVTFASIVRSAGAFTTDGSLYQGGGGDLYVGRLSADGQTVEMATYLGGSGGEFNEHRVAIGPDGSIYSAGAHLSPDFPTTPNADDQTVGGVSDAFLVKHAPDASVLWSTNIGGSSNVESMFGPSLDAAGAPWVAGYTESSDFELTSNAPSVGPGGGRDVVLRRYHPGGRLELSMRLGGTSFDQARAIAVAPNGDIIVAGECDSTDFPTTGGAFEQANPTGALKGFVVRVRPPAFCDQDVDGDGDTDVFDFSDLASAFGATGLTPYQGGDLDGDGDVDVFDFAALASEFGCSES